jgi:uncharacterized protein YdeI (BOF family)
MASPAFAVDPYEKADETWISLSGTVTSSGPDSFILDYGGGIITVEMDDWDQAAEGYQIMVGDKVTVSGCVDDDLFETTTVEASSVYVEDLNTYFYANSADEEDYDTFLTMTTPINISATIIQGTVTGVHDDEFVVNTGLRAITVDTDEMPYDPLDDQGFQQIDIGDRVSVMGAMDERFWEGRKLVAESIVTLYNGEHRES